MIKKKLKKEKIFNINMFERKCEYFKSEEKVEKEEVAIMTPKYLFRQERDWTCSIACLRSITSSMKSLGSEDKIFKKYDLKPSPYYSKDIKNLHILDKFKDVIYGCDYDNASYVTLYDLLKKIFCHG